MLRFDGMSLASLDSYIIAFKGDGQMADKKTVKPGEKTQDSGIYEDSGGKKTTQVKGKTAPPTSGKGEKHSQDVDTNPNN